MNNEITNYIEKFGEYLKEGLAYIRKACEVYVKAIDSDPSNIHRFKEKYELTDTAWIRFEQVGRGLLHEKLLTDYSLGARKLKMLSFSEQARYTASPVEYLTKDNDVLKIQLCNLTRNQIKQVFAEDHVRSIAEQRAFIESSKDDNINPVPAVPYYIKNSKLIIKEKDISFSLNQLKKIIKDIES